MALLLLTCIGCSGDTATPQSAASTPQPDGAAATAPAGQEVTLTLGNPLMDMPEQLVAWAAEVRDRTDETIRFDVISQFGGEVDAWPDREQLLLDAVASGEVDLAWVGARAVPAFEPLLAPMLVDSHDLQEAVFAAGLPARMLGDLDLEGATGLGVLPGPHRRMLGISRDFRTKQDFEGAVVMSEQNSATLQTLEALGVAESVPGREGNTPDGLDGLIAQVGAVVGNSYQRSARSFSTNLNLWPRPLVLLANTAALEGLSAVQQSALREAAEDTLAQQMQITRKEDQLSASARTELCSSPLDLVELTDDELAALRSGVARVLEGMRQDQSAAAYLDEIMAIKEQRGPPPDNFSC